MVLKRIIALFLTGLTLNSFMLAQSLRSFRQSGGATAELNTDQLVASHPSLSMGTKLKVVNTTNGKELIVTVTGRIPASGTRVIDLSRGVAAQLEMNSSGTTPVSIEVYREEVAAAAAPVPTPAPEPPAPAAASAPVVIYNTITLAPKAAPAQVYSQPLVQPAGISIPCPPSVPDKVLLAPVVPVRTQVSPVQTKPQIQSSCPAAQSSVIYSSPSQVVYSSVPAYRQVQPQSSPVQQQQMSVTVSTAPSSTKDQGPVTVYTSSSPAVQLQVLPQQVYVQPETPAAVYTVPRTPAEVSAVVVKPRMPDPAGNGIYRVQVGSYANPKNAQAAAESLIRIGLSPGYEQYGQNLRVVIPGIAARQMEGLIQQLGALGIREVVIRQE
ncbi:MAG: SPOR domain-containing protein [Treponema sp.]|jgi:hypothetical protein|nr:SPOR domain-containing protein [Treponema sp.]